MLDNAYEKAKKIKKLIQQVNDFQGQVEAVKNYRHGEIDFSLIYNLYYGKERCEKIDQLMQYLLDFCLDMSLYLNEEFRNI